MKAIIKMVSSGLYAGYSPIAPGTLGSLWGVLIYLHLRDHPALFILVTVLLFILGFILCGRAEDAYGRKDSQKIVIDEIASMCLVYLFIKPTWLMLGIGFALFRLFDIIKPPPARRIEALEGSKGVMLDDLVAACYTIAVLFIVYILIERGILPGLYR
ncbi:MAG: phosphatidylglycerophosphatase A, partial [Candidatus Omnitrophica bacterium]|nr:phosphatidylglycerophosphatase A [Candidatus Omnitrophota bacterium]